MAQTKPTSTQTKFTPASGIAATNVQAAVVEVVTDLAAPGGSALVGWEDPVAPAYLKTVSDLKNGDEVSLLRAIPKTMHAGILAHTETANVSDYIADLMSQGRSFYAPGGSYNIGSSIGISKVDGFKIRGDGMSSGLALSGSLPDPARKQLMTRFYSAEDIQWFTFDECRYPMIDGILFDQRASHTKYTVRFQDCDNPQIWRSRFNGIDDLGATAVSGVALDDGSGGITSATMATVQGCVFSNAMLDIRQWDCKITHSWVWANSKRWGISAVGSVGNLSITDVDIVPPRTDNASRKGGIWISGPVTQAKLHNIYGDGNYALSTGHVILAEQNLSNQGPIGLQIMGGHSNGVDEDVIVLNGVIASQVIGHSFFDNNKTNLGSHDIKVVQTGTQANDRLLIQGNSHIMSTTRTSMGSAVYVDSSVTRRQLRIRAATIQQPGSGGAYDDVEINLAGGAFASSLEGDLSGCAGTRRAYKAEGSATLTAGDTFKTVTLNSGGAALAYLPRADQVRVVLSGTSANIAVGYRVQVVSTSQVLIGFNTALGGSGTVGAVNVSVEL